MSTPKPTTSTKPAKAVTACNNCRQRKLRCDGKPPMCSNCQLHGTICEYAKGRNKSGPPKGFKRKRPATQREDSEAPVSTRRRLDGYDEAVKIPLTPPMSSPSSSVSANSPLGSSSHTDSQCWSDLIPTYNDPIDSNWLAMLGMPSKEPPSIVPSPFPGEYNDSPLSYSFGFCDFALDPMLPTPLPSTSNTPAATHLSLLSSPLPPQDLSNFSGFLDLASNITSHPPPPHTAHAPSSTIHNLQEELAHQHRPSHINTVRSAHPFVPLFPLPQLLHLLLDCSTRKGSNIPASFFSSAFSALSSITTPEPTLSTPSVRSSHYTSAQEQAMSAYLGVIAGSAGHDDDAVCTAAGLIYLAVRDVFVFGWGMEASTWLWLAAEIVHRMPQTNSVQLAVQRWFARVVWLWNKALARSGVTGAEARLQACFGEAGLQGIRDESPLASLELDEDQRTFSGLVSLCLDLETMMADRNTQAEQQGNTQAFSDITNSPVFPLCQRVRQWVLSAPAAHESLLQFDCEEDGDSIRETVSRLIRLIYYGLSIKLESNDRARCTIKKTSLYLAVTRIVDAVDWFTRSKRTWLWPFAEPALLLCRDFLLERSILSTPISPGQVSRSGSPSTDTACPPSSSTVPALLTGERTLLTLIRDVFAEAAPTFQPGSARALVATQALKGITDVLQLPQPVEPVTKGDMLGGIRQLLACTYT